MQTVEAFFAVQYPCPNCNHVNVMSSNLEHPYLGYMGNCRKCKTRWTYKEMMDARMRSIPGCSEGIRTQDFEEFLRSTAGQRSAIIFDCDSCGQTTTILPDSVEHTTQEVTRPECEAPYVDGDVKWKKTIEYPVYAGAQKGECPDTGKCSHCGEEFNLSYPVIEWLNNQG